MATYGRREVTKTTVEFPVPVMPEWGACWGEVYKAVRSAHQELWAAGVVEKDHDAPDDLIRFRLGDDEIIVFYERSDTRSA